METQRAIPALTSPTGGRQFVLIGDSHTVSEGSQFQAINTVIERLQPAPEFICLAGDHIWGWTEDVTIVNEQWQQWFAHNSRLLRYPIFHCTANHTVLGPQSAALYCQQFADIPDNGPEGGKTLNYYIRDKDFLLVVVNTAWNPASATTGRMGGQRVETAWLAQVLSDNTDAACKFVMGHHPVFPVDGFDGGMLVEANSGKEMWDLLVRHGVRAYLCAHIIAFDVQVQEGVLHITSGGGGFPYFFGKQDTEYNHCVQLAVDSSRLYYQTLDIEGNLREWLTWPLRSPAPETWREVTADHGMPSRAEVMRPNPQQASVVYLRLRGTYQGNGRQTLLSGADEAYWIGIQDNQLSVRLKPIPPRNEKEGMQIMTVPTPDYSMVTITEKRETDTMTWTGPTILTGDFDVQLAIHMGMGPGGFLFRPSEHQAWSSMSSGAWHGPSDADWPEAWSIGEDVQVSCLIDVQTFEECLSMTK
jgi:hypothetical protein